MILYTPVLYDPFGRRLAALPQIGGGDSGAALDYVLTTVPGAVGDCTLTLPPRALDAALLNQHTRLGIWRSIHGRAPMLDGNAIWLLQDVTVSAAGLELQFAHANCLLQTRVIAYPSDGVFVQRVAAPADDQIKALARENLGALINGTQRYGVETQADLSAYLQIAADLGQGASIPVADIAQRTLAEVARDLCQASAQAGTWLTVQIEAITPALLELRTYAGQRGVDRSRASGSPFVLSEQNGRLENVRVTRSWRDTASMVLAGGAGDGSLRAVATAFDAARAAASPFGRIERFIESSNTGNFAVLQQQANAALRAARETVMLTADLRETPSATRGVHYDVGDVLIAQDARATLETSVRLDVVRVTVGNGQQQSQASLRSL